MKQGEEPPPPPIGGFNEMEALAELNEDDELLVSQPSKNMKGFYALWVQLYLLKKCDWGVICSHFEG